MTDHTQREPDAGPWCIRCEQHHQDPYRNNGLCPVCDDNPRQPRMDKFHTPPTNGNRHLPPMTYPTSRATWEAPAETRNECNPSETETTETPDSATTATAVSAASTGQPEGSTTTRPIRSWTRGLRSVRRR